MKKFFLAILLIAGLLFVKTPQAVASHLTDEINHAKSHAHAVHHHLHEAENSNSNSEINTHAQIAADELDSLENAIYEFYNEDLDDVTEMKLKYILRIISHQRVLLDSTLNASVNKAERAAMAHQYAHSLQDAINSL